MPLLVPVPPTPTMPAEASHPPQHPLAEGGGENISLVRQSGDFDILGRNGNPATAQQIATVLETLWWNPDPAHPLGSHTLMNWHAYVGRGGGRWGQRPFITFEFRTPAEVAAAAAGTHGAVPFAVTLWHQDALTTVPPIDGASYFGFLYPDDFSDGTEGQPIARVLIREDLDTGGAGSAWDGTSFLAETIQHELGHVVQYMLIDLYGLDWVKANVCNIFGRPTSEWSDPALAWEDRVQESSAEVFKDVMLPGRRYSNRTSHKLSFARFNDFEEVFVGYSENAYWEADVHEIQYSANTSTFLTYLLRGGAAFYWAINDAVASTWSNPLGHADPVASLLALPFEGEIKQYWNFEAQDFNPSAPDWASWDPSAEAKVKVGVGYSALDGSADFQLDFTEVNSTHPPKGSRTETVPEGSLPSDAFAMNIYIGGSETDAVPWEFPRTPPVAGLLDDAVLPPSLIGPSFRAPGTGTWFSLLAKRARPPFRVLPWPYVASVLHVGASKVGRSQVPWRVRGRRLRFS